MTIAMVMHLLNAMLAGIVVGMCALQTNWRFVNRVRNSRIIGMALVNIGIVWFSLVHRIEPFQPWVPILTVGLLFSIHGLRNALNEGTEQLAANTSETL